ncbi:MAG: 4Fe-4S binding protein [Tepidisphaeraceae bacterium]|jgi:hypothetical protein
MHLLPILQPGHSRLRSVFLRVYRLVVLIAILWMIRIHAARMRIDTDAPIRVDEARVFFPQAAALDTDTSDRLGLFVRDLRGRTIGYVLRTSPLCDKIVGYSGPTDTLIALDPAMKVVGIRVRSSADTKQHVADVRNDEYFMSLWTDKSWDEVAGMEPQKARIEGVSGASLTSLCIANSIQQRFKLVAQGAVHPPPPRWHAPDYMLTTIIAVACVFTFTHLRGRSWLRRAFQLVLVAYVGMVSGQMLSQSQLAGWAASAVPWRIAPGMAVLAAAALLVPWSTRRPVYCSHVCPHGAAQEWVGRLSPWRARIPGGLHSALRWLPPGLLALVLAITLLNLPFDAAGIEPFDAYLVRTAGPATIAVALAGLFVSLFVPMAYCKYGCPTGSLLNFVRFHGAADHFSRRDLVAAGFLLLAYLLQSVIYARVHQWIFR